MPGGIIQLIAYGAEDLYLTGTPQITFFNSVYKRYTNFSTEYIELYQEATGSLGGQNNTIINFKVDRNADLLYDCYLIFDLPAIFTQGIPFGWVEDIGNMLTYKVRLLIGGQTVEERSGLWNSIESKMNLPYDKYLNYQSMIGTLPQLLYTNQSVMRARRLYIPLNFFFCKNSGLSLPLIALQYTDVYIQVEFNSLNNLIRVGDPLISPLKMLSNDNLEAENAKYRQDILDINPDINQYNLLTNFFAQNWNQNFFILANYVYLDEDERRKLAQNSLEYLITQVQDDLFQGLMSGPNTLDLRFNHPCKEFIWVLQDAQTDLTNNWLNFTSLEYNESLKFIEKNLYNNSIKLYYPNLKSYLSSEVISQYLDDIERDYGSVDINQENINNDFNNFYSIMKSSKLIFNNHDRFQERDFYFFENLQLYKYHKGQGDLGIYCYNFGLNPQEFQPSGTCNMSRIDNQQIFIEIFSNRFQYYRKFNCYMFATNYNVLRIMGGIGQLVYAN